MGNLLTLTKRYNLSLGSCKSAAAVKFMLFLSLCRSETHMLVQGLEPRTMYEFAVRLHVDQLSSPWSPVVYHTTLPEGKALGEQHAVLERFVNLKAWKIAYFKLSVQEILLSELHIVLFSEIDRQMLSGKSSWNCEILSQNLPKISNNFYVKDTSTISNHWMKITRMKICIEEAWLFHRHYENIL